MKSVSKKSKYCQKPPLYKQQSSKTNQKISTQQSLTQQQFRRYSELPTQQVLPNVKNKGQQSRVTNIKSDHPSRKYSLTPTSKANSSIYIAEYKYRYKQLEQILKKQNQNLIQQNEFLKNQVRQLYERQCKYKQSIRRYKDQIKFIKIENDIYQQRYSQIKNYINNVIQRMNQLTTNINQEEYNDQKFRNSSLQMVAKLREELTHYENIKYLNQNNNQNLNIKDNYSNQNIINNNLNDLNYSQQYLNQQNQVLPKQKYQQDTTNNFIYNNNQSKFKQQIIDLQQTRFIKDLKYTSHKNDNFLHPKKKSSQGYSSLKPLEQYCHKQSLFSQNQSSTPNSDSKTIDQNFKPNNFLQDTSQSNCLPNINQKIQQLTDQSQALMYELKKTNNQDNDIKKKIIRISQKIRQLKMETNNWQQQRFTSLQNIMPKQ